MKIEHVASAVLGAGPAGFAAVDYVVRTDPESTPARTDEALPELTIQSVAGQAIRRIRYVIVSDGAPDRTNEITGVAKVDEIIGRWDSQACRGNAGPSE